MELLVVNAAWLLIRSSHFNGDYSRSDHEVISLPLGKGEEEAAKLTSENEVAGSRDDSILR